MRIEYIKSLFALFGGIIASHLGGFDLLLKSLLLLAIFDFITRFTVNVYNKKGLSSGECFKGICKKVLMFIFVALSVIVENVTGNNIPLRDMVVVFYIVNESLSILENGGEVIVYPKKLKEVISQLNNEG